MIMNIKEIRVIVKLTKNLTRKNYITEQRNLINSSLKYNENLLKLHEGNRERVPFSFNLISTNSSIFEKDKVFEFTIRSTSTSILNEIKQNILHFENSGDNHTAFKVITVRNKSHNKCAIKKVTSDTPIILMNNNEKEKAILPNDLDYVLSELNRTMVFKYNKMMDKNLPLDLEVFNGINIKKDCIKLSTQYNGVDLNFLGFTADLYCSLDEDSQNVLDFCMSIGVGTKCNFVGSGFLVAKGGI